MNIYYALILPADVAALLFLATAARDLRKANRAIKEARATLAELSKKYES